MPRPLIRAVEIDKAYGGRRLFENATFRYKSVTEPLPSQRGHIPPRRL